MLKKSRFTCAGYPLALHSRGKHENPTIHDRLGGRHGRNWQLFLSLIVNEHEGDPSPSLLTQIIAESGIYTWHRKTKPQTKSAPESDRPLPHTTNTGKRKAWYPSSFGACQNTELRSGNMPRCSTQQRPGARYLIDRLTKKCPQSREQTTRETTCLF